MAERFDRFTERARNFLRLAQEEAQRFNHNWIGTEHLLLGLVREDEGVAAKVLGNLGIELNKVRGAVEFIIGRGDRTVAGDIGLTPRAKKVIELSVDEARRLGHENIGTEHLLLGLIREGEGIAAGVLQSLGISLGKVRSEVMYVLNPSLRFSGTAPPFQPSPPVMEFSTGAARANDEAAITARWFGHPEISTAHLLVGLLREREGLAAQALRAAGVHLEPAVAEVQRLVPRGQAATTGDVGLSGWAKQAMDRAELEARQRGFAVVGTEHLLIGVLAGSGDEPGGRLLAALGISPGAVRAALEQLIGGGSAS
jgi:ATP-dependent Clp protease ATP-binding subunit ClpA